MSLRSAVLVAGAAGLLLSAAGAVRAQVAKPDPPKAEAAKPESAEMAAAAAMERAQRMAANPMKVIMQASKIRRRPDAELASEGVRASVRPAAAVATAASALPRVAPVPAAVAVVAPSLAAVSAPPPVQTATSAPAPAAATVEAAATEPPAPSAAPVSAAVSAAVNAAAITAPLGEAPQAPAFVAPAALQPKLVTMIEPDIPGRLLAEGPRVVEIFADLALRPDGTVGGVTLLPGVPRAWQRFVTAALERWRFEPLPAARVHRVQLVFGD